MPRSKKAAGPTLEEEAARLMTIEEASLWLEEHREEFGLNNRVPNRETLKKAAQFGRLKAVLKGRVFLTREEEVRAYMAGFDPKNKTENKPIKARAIQRRAAKAKLAAQTEAGQGETAAEPVAKRGRKAKQTAS